MSLDMYGIAEPLRSARAALTHDARIWETKHEQDELLCFTTRGNTAPNIGGVNAHNGFKLPKGIVVDSEEDRRMMRDLVIARDGRVDNDYRRFPSFQELSRREDRRDFIPTIVKRAISMDYDLKRRPIMQSMRAVLVTDSAGDQHEVATFLTEPWDTVDQARRAREIAKEIARDGCLRTVDQWRAWDLRFRLGTSARSGVDRRILMSIVIAHRQGVDEIPALRSGRVADRLAWLGAWGLGELSPGDWKNARKPERASSMLPKAELEPYLAAMRACPHEPGALTEDLAKAALTAPVDPDPMRGVA